MNENVVMEPVTEEPFGESGTGVVQAMKKTTAGIGWKYAVFAVVVTVLQFLYAWFLPESFADKPWATWMQIILPMYVIGFPFLFLLIGKMEKVSIEKKKMGFGKFILSVFIGAGICFVGMIIGVILNFAFTLPFGVNAEDTSALASLLLTSDAGWRILTVGICAPIFEELIFRKLLVDRLVKYGEFLAIMASGLMFGIFHGNFQQVFFATGLGMFWAFIYLRTGKIQYTIAMHMIINLSTSVVTVFLTQAYMERLEVFLDPNYMTNVMNGDPEVVSAIIVMLLYLGWIGILGIFGVVGIILFFVNLKKFRLNPAENGLTKGQMFGKGLFTWGMILFWLICLLLFAQYYVSMALMAAM